MRSSNHPWRRARSNAFVTYLGTLTSEERQRIETAEQAFVLRAEAATSPQIAAARYYAAGMRGVCELQLTDG